MARPYLLAASWVWARLIWSGPVRAASSLPVRGISEDLGSVAILVSVCELMTLGVASWPFAEPGSFEIIFAPFFIYAMLSADEVSCTVF